MVHIIHRQELNQSLILAADFITRSLNEQAVLAGGGSEREIVRSFHIS